MGRGNIRGLKAPFVLVANHENMYDPFYIGAALPFRPRIYPYFFIAKKKLMWTPVVGQVIWALGAYTVPRKVGLELSMAKTLELVKAGHNVYVFPEGKVKLKHGRARNPRRGIAYFVKHFSDVQLLPVFVQTSPRTQGGFWRGQVSITFGPPFTYRETGLKPPYTLKEMNQTAEAIMARVRALK